MVPVAPGRRLVIWAACDAKDPLQSGNEADGCHGCEEQPNGHLKREGRRAIAAAAFDHIEAVGLNLLLHSSVEAERYGLPIAFGPDPLEVPPSRYGRGERVSAEAKYQPLMIPVANVPSRVDWVADTA